MVVFSSIDTPLVDNITGRVESEVDDVVDVVEGQFCVFLPCGNDALHLADQLVVWIDAGLLF